MDQFSANHTTPCERIYAHIILPVRFRGKITYQVPGIYSVREGSRVKVDFAGKIYSGVVRNVITQHELQQQLLSQAAHGKVSAKNIVYKPIQEVEELPEVSREELVFWEQLADYYLCSIGEVFKAAYPGRALKQEGVKPRKSAEQFFNNLSPVESIVPPKLSEAQQLVYEDIAASIFAPGGAPEPQTTDKQPAPCNLGLPPKPVLLKGVTGSGKTEIYIHLAKEALSRGKSVLYMVPEIALSKQLYIRLQEVFGERLLVFHSKQTTAEKGRIQKILTYRHPDNEQPSFQTEGNNPMIQTEQKSELPLANTPPTAKQIQIQPDNTPGTTLQSGGNPIGHTVLNPAVVILGTRSAVLLPHKELGVVIIDEEHDSSYKQSEPSPRYHARDAAIMLANLHRAAVVMGTATPSFESEYNAKIGRFRKVELNEKYHGAPEPQVEVIDTLAAYKSRQMSGSFSQKLINEIRKTLASQGQVLIFRNRRSYSPVVECTECGAIPKCPHCNVYLSYHKYNHTLRCHYCDYTASFVGICPTCGLDTVRYKGAGTEKLEEELNKLFPEAVVSRYDADVAKSKQQEEQTLRDFTSGKIQILIGTQMISKGFDFSRLNLVAVIQAETILGIQDFRADEKALQLLSQLMGRTGRRTVRGKLLIQCTQKEHPVFNRLKQLADKHLHQVPGTIPETSPEQEDGQPGPPAPHQTWQSLYPLDHPDSSTLSSLLEERREFKFAPYVRMVKMIVKHRNPEKLDLLCTQIASAGFPCLELTGPFVPAIDKIRGEYIKCFYVKYARDSKLASNKEALLKAIEAIHGHQAIILDVDPL